MQLPLQLFGTIETSQGLADAMFCMDIDRPEEAMVHWWGANIDRGAVLVRLIKKGNDVLELVPLLLYRTNDGGGLFAPILSDSEIEYRNGFSCILKKNEQLLEGEWTNKSGKKGHVIFKLSDLSHNVEPRICANWGEFKDWANQVRDEGAAAVFRGHGSNRFKLESTLHRVGRSRLERYSRETLREFHGHAEAILSERFDFANGDDYSSLLGLARHHGLPTPLLDWTNSPYIAAFFAFADTLDSQDVDKDDTHVRIYGLSKFFIDNWAPASVAIPYISPYVAFLSISARNNPRLYAQQGKFIVTNVIDVEHFLCDIEKKSEKKVLIAADVPISCANEAMQDLQFMGLSAASMFPGLDGACRMMKHNMSTNRQL